MSLVSTRTLRYIFVFAGGLAGVLLFLLASASANTSLFARHYPWLLGLNALLALALLVLVIVMLRRLWRRYRAGVFGSRLMMRLALSFALMGIVPGAAIYLVSVQFLSKSIESWFNVRVDAALESGLNLGRNALDALLAELSEKARFAAGALADQPDALQVVALARLRDQFGVEDMALLTSSGRVLATAGARLGSLLPDLPSAQVIRQARMNRLYAAVEDDGNGMHLRVVIAVASARSFSGGMGDGIGGAIGSSFGAAAEPRYLQLLQTVPRTLASNAEAVQSVYRDYQELSLSRNGLRSIYTVTLTLTLLLAMLAAVAAAFLLASWLAEPLLQLARATRAVAEGDYSPLEERSGNDELVLLMRSFNVMTRQLTEARAAVEQNRQAVENARAFLESILANMSAGVLVFDSQFCLAIANQGAERIFGLSPQQSLQLGATLDHSAAQAQIPPLLEFASQIRNAFAEQAAADAAEQSWQKQIALQREIPGEEQEAAPFVLLVRGSRLPIDQQQGYVVVFDDISDVISVQRSAAWGEVARRLAHEIKNPLTPIQLSAERLQMKLAERVAPEDKTMLARATETIVNQVTAMKRMVDEFRDYARMPPAQLHPLNLNSLVLDVLQLYGYGGDSESADRVIRVELAEALPDILGDAAQLRQLIHNLLQNAQDALSDQPQPRILIVTEAVAAKGAEQLAWVRLRVEDNGSGFPAKILNRAFEPYITTKAKGTGLGLAIVKKIVEEHQGRIDLQNRLDEQQQIAGARVSVLFRQKAAEFRV